MRRTAAIPLPRQTLAHVQRRESRGGMEHEGAVMSPTNRFFIGPLTPAQQRRRKRNRDEFRQAQEIADARYVSMADAFKILRRYRGVHVYHGYATGEMP